MATDTITASQFKAKCLALMDEVARSRRALTITKNGKPVAQLIPAANKEPSLFGLHRDRVKIIGDVISPLDEPWESDG